MDDFALRLQRFKGYLSRDELTLKDFNSYFPNRKYSEINSHLKQSWFHVKITQTILIFIFVNSCTICLEDFEQHSICKKIFCGHIYHEKCIEPWLNQFMVYS